MTQFYRALELNGFPPTIHHQWPSVTKTTALNTLIKNISDKHRASVAFLLGAIPFEMDQYGDGFGVTRIPGLHQCCTKHYAGQRHIVVMHRDN